jgi:hypothetical protein
LWWWLERKFPTYTSRIHIYRNRNYGYGWHRIHWNYRYGWNRWNGNYWHRNYGDGWHRWNGNYWYGRYWNYRHRNYRNGWHRWNGNYWYRRDGWYRHYRNWGDGNYRQWRYPSDCRLVDQREHQAYLRQRGWGLEGRLC